MERATSGSATPTTLRVNGEELRATSVGGHVTVLDWLRTSGLTGVKEGCAEGECGACAVLVARPDGQGSRWTAVNACLVPVAALDGQEIVTAEGLAGRGQSLTGRVPLHPVQQEMADRGGSQCGYCTPGFVCSMAAEFYRADREPTGQAERVAAAEPATTNGHDAGRRQGQSAAVAVDPVAPGHSADHEHGPNGFDLHALSGNLCRCTGYRPIRDAAYALGQPDAEDPLALRRQQPAPGPVRTHATSAQGDLIRPGTLAQALELLAEHPDAVLLGGGTDWGVELNLRHARAGTTIALDRLDELRGLDEDAGGFTIGAALSLSEIERGLAGRIPLLAELFPQFASRLIRNGATLGGNLGTASPIGDSLPVLLALEVSLVLASTSGERTVALADYFTGYRQTLLRPDELVATVRVPKPLAKVSAFHKMAKRRFDDISSVAVAFALDLDGDGVSRIGIGLGGVAATPIRARATEAALIGQRWTRDTVEAAARTLGEEGTPMNDHRASAAYRAAMLRQALRKFHTENPAPDDQAPSLQEMTR